MLKALDIQKAFDGAPLFTGISLVLGDGDRVGLVGPNGTGKTTLLRILAGAERPDRGTVSLGPGERVGYLAQQAPKPDVTLGRFLAESLGEVFELHEEVVALERRMAAGDADPATLRRYGEVQERYGRLDGWTFDRSLREARERLGIAHLDADAPLRDLSGGEQARVLLAGVLLARPSVLLLDEPTNHLDLEGLGWLESFLEDFAGAVLVVSHDRRFLDRAATRMVELDGVHDELQTYVGGYTEYREEKARRFARLQSEFEAQEKYRRRMVADIAETRAQAQHTERTVSRAAAPHQKRIAKKVARKAQSRERRLDRQMRSDSWLDEPELAPTFKVKLRGEAQPGARVATLDRVSVALGRKPVLYGVDLDLHGRDRVAIVGRNGTGKSTLLSLLAGTLRPDAGRVDVATTPAFLPQTHQRLPLDRPLLSFFRSRVAMEESEARTLLGHFLFEQDRIGRRIGTLSPGERSRLLLATIVASGSELLLLDEPTNHLDLTALEAVEAALRAYRGTLVVVSHDRAFIDNVGCDRVVELVDGRLRERALAA
jgi:ATPase subunit of ABC transporter with duplicated ATPase domains